MEVEGFPGHHLGLLTTSPPSWWVLRNTGGMRSPIQVMSQEIMYSLQASELPKDPEGPMGRRRLEARVKTLLLPHGTLLPDHNLR